MPDIPTGNPDVRRRRSAEAVAVMVLFALWSGALAVGFGAALVVAYDRLGPARTALYVLLTVLLTVASLRTLVELIRPRRS